MLKPSYSIRRSASTSTRFGATSRSTRQVFTVSPLPQPEGSTCLATAWRNTVSAERAAYGDAWDQYSDEQRKKLSARRATLETILGLRSMRQRK